MEGSQMLGRKRSLERLAGVKKEILESLEIGDRLVKVNML